MAKQDSNLGGAWWAKNLDDVDNEIARLSIACNVRILDPGVIERVLENDASVCGSRNPAGFEKLRTALKMHYHIRGQTAGSMKTDDAARPAFERAGCEPFAYSRRDRTAVTLGYWTAPEQALESPRAMEPWARLSLAAALRAKDDNRATTTPRKPSADKRRPAAAKASKTRVAKARG